MSSEHSIEELQKEVRYVRDRLDIQDCLMRHCRGVDRHDAELMASCYHADAVIKHANRDQLIAGAEYGEWSNAGNWDNGVPGANSEVNIAGDATVMFDSSAARLVRTQAPRSSCWTTSIIPR